MRRAIHALKYARRPVVAVPLATLMVERGAWLLSAPEAAGWEPGPEAGPGTGRARGVPPPGVDAILAVPLHRSRLMARGFNQAASLAGPCAASWGLPLLARALVRVRPTRSQTELDESERRANVRGAFRVVRPADVAGRRILLVDDVLTTGATAGAAAEALLDAGAATVDVLVLARTASPGAEAR